MQRKYKTNIKTREEYVKGKNDHRKVCEKEEE